jgi:predicted RNA-binding protein with PUA-like domain
VSGAERVRTGSAYMGLKKTPSRQKKIQRAKEIQYWLMKSEPEAFSIDDLARATIQTTSWDGVRNYQARNFMRSMRVGDQVLFYHSNTDPSAMVGIAEVVRKAYPDPTQFDSHDAHYDPASSPKQPRWDMVDIRLIRRFAVPLSLERLRQEPQLKHMELLRKGSRLSVQPVRIKEWETILRLERLEGRGHKK